jgi:dolichol kinase
MSNPSTKSDRIQNQPRLVQQEAERSGSMDHFPSSRTLRADFVLPSSQTAEDGENAVGLNQTEWRRRLWHMFPGTLPFILWLIPHEDPISPILNGVLIFMIGGLAFIINARHATIARSDDQNWFAGVIGYSASVIATVLLFQNQLELGLTVLAVLAFGDGMATLTGMTLQGPKLPWNQQKTWSGSLGFLVCSTLMASVIYWGEAQPAVPFRLALLCCGVTSLAAAIAESVPSKINDNIRVGIVAAASISIMHGLVIGWN